jgi:predicted metalloprotease
MRWQGRRQSENIRDVRDSGGGIGGLGGGSSRGPFVVRRASGGSIGILIVIVIIAWIAGINPLELLSGGGGGTVSTGPAPQGQTNSVRSGASDEMRDFVATVLADTEDTWKEVFAEHGQKYTEPTLTLFSGSVQSACGAASAASGPFYCPNDQNLYIDLDFYEELRQRFGAPGDFAQAYVLAHEVGHHVQNLLGILDKVHSAEARLSEGDANALSVRTELQADCLAGVWANHTQKEGILEEGDIDEALTAAAAVGDDTIQRRTQGYVVPETFNHGTSAQRKTWFTHGFKGGDIDSCDTFSGSI